MSHEADESVGSESAGWAEGSGVAQLQLVVGTREPGQLFQFLNAGGKPRCL